MEHIPVSRKLKKQLLALRNKHNFKHYNKTISFLLEKTREEPVGKVEGWTTCPKCQHQYKVFFKL